MKVILYVIALMIPASAVASVVYSFETPPYGASALPPFTPDSRLSGTVTMNTPLPANSVIVALGNLQIPDAVYLQAADWQLSDGVFTYTPSNTEPLKANDPDSLGIYFATGANGEITFWYFGLLSPGAPHAPGDLLNYLQGGGNESATSFNYYLGIECLSASGDPATCDAFDTSTAERPDVEIFQPTQWTAEAAPIPSLSTTGLGISALLLLLIGLLWRRSAPEQLGSD